MFKKFVERCKRVVEDRMNKCELDSNNIDDIRLFTTVGWVLFIVLTILTVLTFFVGWTTIAVLLGMYNIFNLTILCIGANTLTMESYEKIINNIEKDIEEMKKNLF